MRITPPTRTAEIEGMKQFQTQDGRVLNWIAKGKCEVVRTKDILVSDDPMRSNLPNILTILVIIAKHLDRKKPHLKFQVTRIEPHQKLWEDLGKTGVGRENLPICRCRRGRDLPSDKQEAQQSAEGHHLRSERYPASNRSPSRT